MDFLGFTFRYDRDLKGRSWKYLNVTPSKKSLKRARDRVREMTGPKMCFKPTPEMVKDPNRYMRGWSTYFNYGYPRKPFRDISHYSRQRVVTYLNRRSQRKYLRTEGQTRYGHLKQLRLLSL